MYVAHALVADESEPHSLRHLLNHYVCFLWVIETLKLISNFYRISISFHLQIQMGTHTHGNLTDIGALVFGIWLFQLLIRFRYKNRQIIGPRLKCQGVDMNRWVSHLYSFFLI